MHDRYAIQTNHFALIMRMVYPPDNYIIGHFILAKKHTNNTIKHMRWPMGNSSRSPPGLDDGQKKHNEHCANILRHA